MDMEWRETDGYDVGMTALLCGMLGVAPLALGSVAPWARGVLVVCSLILLAMWLLQGMRRGEFRVARTPVWFFVVGFFGLALFQLVPLQSGMLKVLSPETYRVYARAIAGFPEEGGARALALNPHATWGAIKRYFVLAVVFFIVVNTFRRRWQVMALVLTLIVLGTFQALYGFGEQFSGNQHIFWMPNEFSTTGGVFGTFVNKNHFAGLMEMIVPVGLGLLIGLSSRVSGGRNARTGARSWWVRLSHILSDRSIYRGLLLGAVTVVMFVAIFFSLSRAGTVATVFSVTALGIITVMSAGFRRYTVVLVLLVGIVVLISTGVGMHVIVERMEEAVGEEAPAWSGRVRMMRSAIPYVNDYKTLGSGLGTFRHVFPRYQSARFGDGLVRYLHNDWMQLFCEMGLVGGLILIAGLLYHLVSTAHVFFRRRIPFSRWVATGCFLGILAMIIHSFFDANLSLITSNAMVFAALLGVMYVSARLPGKRRGSRSRLRYWTVSAGSVPAKAGAAVAAGVLLAGPLITPGSDIGVDLDFSRFLAMVSEPDYYFFLPVGQYPDESGESWVESQGNELMEERAEEYLESALEADPNNPQILSWAGRRAIDRAEEAVRDRAAERASAFLGREMADEDPDTFERVVEVFSTNLRRHMLSEIRPHLEEARDFLTRAIDVAPTRSKYHVLLAGIERELSEDGTGGKERAKTALWLAPNKPWILYQVGRVRFLQQVRGEGDVREETVDDVLQQFRRAIAADPSYTDDIYPIIEATGRYGDLIDATPRTTRAYRRLCRTLEDARRWEMLLEALETQEDLARAALAGGDPDEIRDRRSPEEILLSVARRRARAYTQLGRWRARGRAVEQYEKVRDSLVDEVQQEARRMRDGGRPRDALRVYLDELEKNWDNPELLLAAADVASLPGVAGDLPPWQRPLDQLYRLVVQHDDISEDLYDRIKETLDTLPLRDEQDQMVGQFVEAVAQIKAGQSVEPREALESLGSRDDEDFHNWRQRHLVWYYLGRAEEMQGSKSRAREHYRRVLEAVPNHLPSLLRMRELDEEAEDEADDLLPHMRCNVGFSGKIELLGYEISRRATVDVGDDSDDMTEDVYLRLYWLMLDRLHKSYRPVISAYDAHGRRLMQRRVRISDREGEEYPIEHPRHGEVVVMEIPLVVDVQNIQNMTIQLYTPMSLDYLPRSLYTDTGRHELTLPVGEEIIRGTD